MNVVMTDFPILFGQKSLDDLRRVGAMGGRAYARNCRARRLAAMATALPLESPVLPPVETTAQAIATLDAQFPRLRGAERRR